MTTPFAQGPHTKFDARVNHLPIEWWIDYYKWRARGRMAQLEIEWAVNPPELLNA